MTVVKHTTKHAMYPVWWKQLLRLFYLSMGCCFFCILIYFVFNYSCLRTPAMVVKPLSFLSVQ